LSMPARHHHNVYLVELAIGLPEEAYGVWQG
jgi:hypothetical protein